MLLLRLRCGARAGLCRLAGSANMAKTGQKQANMGQFPKKSLKTCGNRPFSIDFTRPEVAL
jgi:hypothetical protein